MFNFKKKKKNNIDKIKMQLINVKMNKNNDDVFVGKFISIDINENEEFYITSYNNKEKTYEKISNKIDKKYYALCKQYKYGIVYQINNGNYDIAIICENGYLKTYDVLLSKHYSNGTAFLIENNYLLENNKIIGEIYNLNENISINSLYENKLICFIKK